MYVRRKTNAAGVVFYQLVENRREDGQPRQRVLLHLGRYSNVDDALEKWSGEIQDEHRRAMQARRLGEEVAEGSTARRDVNKRATTAERRARELEDKLKKLRRLRKQGLV